MKKIVLFLTLFMATMVATAQQKQRVLVIAELGGQHGAFTQRGLEWLKQKAREMDFEMTEVNDCHRLKAGDVASYDLIVQLNYPPYAWSDASMPEFERAIDEGTVAWVGFHHASLLGEFDGYQMWQWFSDFLGGIRFQNYIAEKADGLMTVEDPGHPVMAGVNPKFVVREDEWYTYDRNPRPNVHVLASVDENSYEPASNIKMGDHPVVWTNLKKKARNVYFQIGHSASLFDNPDFVRMFTNALCWGLHRPMPLSKDGALETLMEGKSILQSELVAGEFTLAAPTSTGRRANGSAGDPDYATYGQVRTYIPLGGRNLEEYNQLSMDVRSDLDAGIANLNLAWESDPWPSLGAHLVNMQNGQGWQHVVYQISELPRSRVYGLRIYTDLKGRNLSRQDSIHYYIRNVRLERVARPEQVSGWQVQPGQVAYSMAGYLPQGSKTAIVGAAAGRPFRLVDVMTDKTVFEGTTSAQGTADFSKFQRGGIYRLVCDSLATKPFPISATAMTGTAWKVLNYIYCQRCGDAVAGIHGKCHTDVFCDHEGRSYTYGGGWHDAGDLSQQTLQTGDVAFALLEACDAEREHNPQLARLLADEARHGLAQLLRTRMGGGWRASSIGLLHWTDGQVGTADDIHSVRKQNLAMDNFLSAAYEAYAAIVLGDEACRQAAIEDYDFAEQKYRRDGVDTFKITMEHTYNTSDAIFMAAASWASSMLYRLTADERYARQAAHYMRYTLQCQETDGPYAGYFCRDTTRLVPIHFIHQSREQLPLQALALLCQTQPNHADHALWTAAARRYGSYLKQLMPHTAPFAMVPSGVYVPREYDHDADGFSRLHLWAPDNAHQLFDEQLLQGDAVGGNRYVRRFPIWFSIFNGNEAILLSSGKAAALCGNLLHDEELLQIAREQLYWTVGKNPFCQSLIYGEGHRYPSQDSFSSGEIMGEMPVGIRSLAEADVPYWPMTNNACYKEVWLTSAGKWLSLLAELAQ